MLLRLSLAFSKRALLQEGQDICQKKLLRRKGFGSPLPKQKLIRPDYREPVRQSQESLGPFGGPERPQESGKKKAHKHKLFCPVGLGTTPGLSGDFTRFVPGTKPVKTWDKPGFSPYFTQRKPDFTVFVPGTNPVCPRTIPGTKGGTESLCEKSLCAFSLATGDSESESQRGFS